MKYAIATGCSRREKYWTNLEVTWEEFLARVKNTRRTYETMEEYRSFPKEKQDEIKDVGGFVGGRLKDGRRNSASVEYRSMLTLDMDYARTDIWDYILNSYDYTCCIYSTHKHKPSSPRLRLIIPLKRTVSPDEYQAVSRRVAEDIGIEMFDDTTFEACRLMYWPSTSKDGEYIFREKGGPLLDPDAMLSSYTSWKDASTWPLSSRQRNTIAKGTGKQADPTEKGGIIGSFCKAYTVSSAIDKFLPHIYSPSSIPGRYDYIPADSSAGLVIYDEKFAYSHHATDPVCGRFLNAFDLVRLHMFGNLDEGIPENTKPSNLPSFKAMEELALSDYSVKIKLSDSIRARAQEDFTGGERWEGRLEYRRDGTISSTIDNIILIMENDNNLKDTVGYNEFSHRIEILKDLEWRGMEKGPYWTDSDDAALRHYLERVYGISHVGKTMDALAVMSERKSFHPVRQYLESLAWDGTKRLDTLLIDYFGAEDSQYTRSVTRKTLTAAVARVFNPGCKFDCMLVLVGEQGIGKSHMINKLGGRWFSDSLTTVIGKEAYEELQGVWIIEMGELSVARKADIEALKHFVSKQEDIFREAYGRRTSIYPRQCIFIGTTNDYECLRDRTGNRRSWPVRVGRGSKDLWKDLDVDQIWAEAVVSFKAGEELYLKDEAAEQALEAQMRHMEEDDKAGMVYEYLDTLLPYNWGGMDIASRRLYLSGNLTGTKGVAKRTEVCTMEVWCECFGGDPRQLTNAQAREIRSILDRAEGWKRGDNLHSFYIYGRQRAYVRAE